MKERIVLAAVAAAAALGLRAGFEYLASTSNWPEHLQEGVLGFIQHPLVEVIFGAGGTLFGAILPDAWQSTPTRLREIDRNLASIGGQRGSVKIGLLGVVSLLAIGGGILATEIGEPSIRAAMSLPRGIERVVSGIGASLSIPVR